jgi:effector-binding domain-containing protein
VKKISRFAILFAIMAALSINVYAEIDVEIEVTRFEGQKILAVKDSVDNMANISQKFQQAFGEIMQYVQQNSIETTGYPVAVTLAFDEENYSWTFLAGMPVELKNDFIPTGRLQMATIPESKVVKAVMTGPYEESQECYNKIMQYIEENELEVDGNSWETYLNDPANTEPEDLVTHIYFPVK